MVNVFQLLQKKRILVIGDLMLDVYTRGIVQRISPEAPVPVLCVEKEENQPGGAGNAICNLLSLGMEVIPWGRLGADRSGEEFLSLMASEGVDLRGIFIDKSFQTPVKKRMIADFQQLLRVDYENPTPLSDENAHKILSSLPSLIKSVDVVAISDYAKGFLTDVILSSVISLAKKYFIPVIIDPKGTNFKKYKGATLLKPNLGEAVLASGLEKKAPLESIAKKILEECQVETLMVTRSKEGISIFNQKGREDFPAIVHEVKDVTGAGDTVLAIVAATLANRVDLKMGAFLANVAAGIAIEKSGCARITLQELSTRLDKYYATSV